jgi:signal transduction histidine kinase
VENAAPDFVADIDAIARIASVPLILDVICRITGMRFAAVARVTDERWVCLASKDEIQFGLKPGGELDLHSTLCEEVRRGRTPIVIDQVDTDTTYAKHHTPAKYGFQSYISVPIVLSDGSFYGTLCAIDPAPAELKGKGAAQMFQLYAELIASHLDTAQRALRAEANLLDAQAAAELREQFIAVLGHDLRNPINSFSTGLALLRDTNKDPGAAGIFTRMERSVARMVTLIDHVMDFARGRLGGGIKLERTTESLEPTLRHVVDELRSAHPRASFDVSIDLSRPVSVDRNRIGQLLSNLLSNALTHGDKDKPVRVRASTDRELELSVSNEGSGIPAEDLLRLFAPFTRGDAPSDRKGLGLGLYIAAEIARAHGGSLKAESAHGLTRFIFRMPL